MSIHNAHGSTICKNCLTSLPLATNAEGSDTRAPKEGDFSICFECYTIGRYTDDLLVEPMTEIEMELFAKDEPEEWDEVQRALLRLKLYKGQHE